MVFKTNWMSVIMNKTIIALFIFSPLGETGKGVIQRKSLNINIKKKFIPF